MKLWKYSRWDILMFILSLAQLVLTFWLASRWSFFSWSAWGFNVLLLVVMTTYNIIIISHFFTHTPWFVSSKLNAAVSMFNSINIGQSVQAYHLTHVRNHHRYNNDRGKDGHPPQDTSSTFVDGVNGEHVGLIHYAFRGAFYTFFSSLVAMVKSVCFWRSHAGVVEMDLFYSRSPSARSREIAQLRWDRVVQCLALFLLLCVAWDWLLLCYFPALYLSFALVNIQNYYEHFGANPDDSFANSVSHYGRFYNFIAFNDGYHQEHHLVPTAHWLYLPLTRQKYAKQLSEHQRVISPVPAILGFLHRQRTMLHKKVNTGHLRQGD
ncbi:fatty acid desaturase family protein [Serratia fonticola]|uniref:fatty acid desaturase family protein n=1 Tax=Serratia fonticola TaxID=47917 RepID=UPI002DB73836|nr:fatty acid desaturase [Serratia fonticola]MEB7885731.1 fatty acid desaturase [Serratia fonticola]